MPEDFWKPISSLLPIEQPTGIAVPWLVAVEVVRDFTYLRIQAEGSWSALPGATIQCGPDGYAGIPLDPARLVVSDTPLACLIGRFGGSSAGYVPPTTDAEKFKPFPVGRYCIIPVPKFIGPLFIGFNTNSRPVQVTRLKLTIEGATPTPPA